MKVLSLLAWSVGMVILSGACGPQPAPDTRAADERAIRDLEAEWSKLFAAKDLDGFVAFYADDVATFPPNGPMANGKDASRAALKPMFEAPGFSGSFQPTKVEVARSGDMGYSYGTYAMTMNDAKGNPTNDRGKYVTVYKKQADGKWKPVVDIFNSDLPVPAPPAK